MKKNRFGLYGKIYGGKPETAVFWGPTTYDKVSYDALESYLAAAPAGNIICIEVTDIPKDALTGNDDTSALGKKLAACGKKIALKLPETIEGLTDMTSCFKGCTNVVQVSNFPASVTTMESCFEGCTSLTQAPVIPKAVVNMASCFTECMCLTTVPAIPESVINMENCFAGCCSITGVTLDCPCGCRSFENIFGWCSVLAAGGVKVKAEHLPMYKANSVTMRTTAAKFAEQD